jgi:hypothetical protein
MRGVFEQRAECFEKRFVISEEVRFKALARRNKLVGLWAAQLLGYEGEAAKARADALVEAQVGRGDDETLAAELRGELSRGGITLSTHRIRRKMDQAMAQAVEGIQAGQ